jgi:hypothetical protein
MFVYQRMIRRSVKAQLIAADRRALKLCTLIFPFDEGEICFARDHRSHGLTRVTHFQVNRKLAMGIGERGDLMGEPIGCDRLTGEEAQSAS